MSLRPEHHAVPLEHTQRLDDAPTAAAWGPSGLSVGTAAGTLWRSSEDAAADLAPAPSVGPGAPIRRLAPSAANGILSLHADGSVRHDGAEVVGPACTPDALHAQDLCWASDGTIAVVAAGGALRLELHTPTTATTTEPEVVTTDIGPIRCVVTTRGHLVLAGGARGVTWVDARLGVVDHVEPCPPVVALAADPTGRFLAAADVTGDLHLVPIDGGPTQVVGGYPDRIELLDWSADGSYLLAVADDELTAWPVSDAGITAERPVSLLADAGRITAIAAAPHGRRVATGHVDGELLCWHLPGGEHQEALRVGAEVTCVAWSPDACTIAVGAIDGTLHHLTLPTPDPGDPTCP